MRNTSSTAKIKEEMKMTTSLYRGRKAKGPGHLFMTSWEAETDYKLYTNELQNEIDHLGYVKLL